MCKTAKETQMYRTVFWTLWERARVGWLGRMALKHIYYHMWNESPVQVWCMRQGAQDWCTGMTQRNGMGREVGGVFRIGNTCTPVEDSCWCMAKPLQLTRIRKFKKKKEKELYFCGWKYIFICEHPTLQLDYEGKKYFIFESGKGFSMGLGPLVLCSRFMWQSP